MATLTKRRFEWSARSKTERVDRLSERQALVSPVVVTGASGIVVPAHTEEFRLFASPSSQSRARLALQGKLPGPGPHDWLRTVGMIPDDEVTREINAEAERIRRSR